MNDEDEDLDAVTEDMIVTFLCEVLDDDAEQVNNRISAGAALIAHFTRQRGNAAIEQKAKVTAMLDSVRASLRAIALSEDVGVDLRVRAAGVAL